MKHTIMLLCLLSALYFPVLAHTIHVPADQPTVQAAIQAAAAGDTIRIASGRYQGKLYINKSLTLIGSSADSCVIYKNVPSPDSAVVGIDNATVSIMDLEINGGNWNEPLEYFQGFSPKGILAQNSHLSLEGVVVNQMMNYMITIRRGSFDAAGLSLYTRLFLMQCDVGIELEGCAAHIDHLQQASSNIDHTININMSQNDYIAVVKVENSDICASALSWGNCIRAYSRVDLTVRNCNLYRNPGGQPKGPADHSGVGVNGYQVAARIDQNAFSNLPRGIFCYGSMPNSNNIVVESNTFSGCEEGIFVSEMDYEGIDLGGGNFGSNGGNTFSGNINYDVRLENSSSDIYAKFNWWTASNPDDKIWDQLDNGSLGRVLYISKPAIPKLKIPVDGAVDLPIDPVLIWEIAGGANRYHLQVSDTPYFRNLIVNEPKLSATQLRIGPLGKRTKYYWRVEAENDYDVSKWSDTFHFTTGTGLSAVDSDDKIIPGYFKLLPAFPNPFNYQATIEFSTPRTEWVTLAVYDVTGQEVARLISDRLPEGHYRVRWDADRASSGLYFCRMLAGMYTHTIKLSLVK